MARVRIIFFSDTHLGFDYPMRSPVGQRHRGPDFFRNYQTVLDYAKESHADLLVHGGDLFFRSKVPDPIVNMAYAPLFECAESLPIVIVPGNHERSVLPSSLFLTHPNIHVFRRPETFVFDIRGVPLALGGFPFVNDIGQRFEELVGLTGIHRRDAIRLLCLHQSVEGAGFDVHTMSFPPMMCLRISWQCYPVTYMAIRS